MTKPKNATYVNWQARGAEFQVGDVVTPYGMLESQAGRVVQVWPAIGCVDVQFPHGSGRYPVEILQIIKSPDVLAPLHEDIPGGAGTVSVPGGPHPAIERQASANRVANVYIKQALYWAAPDRQYRPSKAELDSGNYGCPKCSGSLSSTIYKRRGGASERLLCCSGCLFLIKKEDLLI